MKKLLILYAVFASITGHGQLVSIIVRGDTLFAVNPSTGEERQLTKTVPSMSGNSGKFLSNNGTAYIWQTIAGGGDLLSTNNLSDIANAGTARTNLGLSIGINVQAFDADLTTYAGITPSANVQILLGSADYAAFRSNLSLGNVTNESKSTMFSSPTFTGTVVLPASTAFTTPVIGAASGTSLAVTGAVTSSGGGIGYATGAGGTVTQATSKSTGVTLNKLSGQITMNGAALAAAAEVAFTLTNSFIASTDVVIVNIQSVGTAGAYFVTVGAVGNGSCSITLGNASAGSLSQAVVLNFAVIKSVSN